jgi:hypothetical protein
MTIYIQEARCKMQEENVEEGDYANVDFDTVHLLSENYVYNVKGRHVKRGSILTPNHAHGIRFDVTPSRNAE